MQRRIHSLIGLRTPALATPAWGQTPLHERVAVRYDNTPMAEVLKDRVHRKSREIYVGSWLGSTVTPKGSGPAEAVLLRFSAFDKE